jgi:hypothetical protein
LLFVVIDVDTTTSVKTAENCGLGRQARRNLNSLTLEQSMSIEYPASKKMKDDPISRLNTNLGVANQSRIFNEIIQKYKVAI